MLRGPMAASPLNNGVNLMEPAEFFVAMWLFLKWLGE